MSQADIELGCIGALVGQGHHESTLEAVKRCVAQLREDRDSHQRTALAAMEKLSAFREDEEWKAEWRKQLEASHRTGRAARV